MKVVFVVSGTLVGFFLGVFYGVVTVPKASGLAGPAIVLGYGVVSALITLVLGFWLGSRLGAALRKKLTIGLLLICLVSISWMYYRYKNNRSKEVESPPATTRPVTPL